MLFPGPRLNTVFASRWKALLWAGGVLATAWCSVPVREAGVPAAQAPAPVHHHSPWDKD